MAVYVIVYQYFKELNRYRSKEAVSFFSGEDRIRTCTILLDMEEWIFTSIFIYLPTVASCG